MKQRIITSVLLVIVVAVCLVMQWVHPIAFDFVIVGLSVVATIEAVNMFSKMGRPAYFSVALAYPITLFGMIMLAQIWPWSALALFLIAVAIMAVFYGGMYAWNVLINKRDLEKDPFRLGTGMSVNQFAVFKSNNTLLSFVYPNLLIFFLYLINHINKAELGFDKIATGYEGVKIALFGIILLLCITTFSDTFAFFVGRTFKGPKLAPKISPNKTWSGAGGGALGGMIGAVVVFLIFNAISPLADIAWWHFIFVGLFGSLFTQAGDLFESWLKRKAGIKDTGSILPGHGGVLDRIDGLIFNIPIIFICLLLIL